MRDREEWRKKKEKERQRDAGERQRKTDGESEKEMWRERDATMLTSAVYSVCF